MSADRGLPAGSGASFTPATRSTSAKFREARRLAKRARQISGNAADPSDWMSVPLPGDEAEIEIDVLPHNRNEMEPLP